MCGKGLRGVLEVLPVWWLYGGCSEAKGGLWGGCGVIKKGKRLYVSLLPFVFSKGQV